METPRKHGQQKSQLARPPDETRKCVCVGGGGRDFHFRAISPLLLAREQLLRTFNEAWSTHQYPLAWFHAHIIPIPKAGKDTTQLDSYRPISLTSCIHKTFERIIQARLLHFIAQHNILSPIHSGFLPNRNTTDNLARLTADIQNAYANKRESEIETYYKCVYCLSTSTV